MRYAVALLLVSTLLLPAARAQSGRGVSSFFLLGYGPFSGSVPARPTGTFPPFDPRTGLVGTDLQYRSRHWLLGLNLTTSLPQQRTEALTGTRRTQSVSNAQVWVGWIVKRQRRFLVYPRLGPGVTTYSQTEESASGAAFVRYASGWSTDVGLAVDWLPIERNVGEALRGGPMLGLRVSYRVSTPLSNWHDGNSASTLPAPSVTPRGVYVTLALGAGYGRP